MLDILKSAELIQAHLVDATTFSVYVNDLKTIDTKKKRLSIIGERMPPY